MKKICVITGTRAEYGLLKAVLEQIDIDSELELFLVATGMHLSPEFGLTYSEIENDGYHIDIKNEMLLSADTPSSVIKSMGVEMIGFADIFAQNSIDMVVLLGDRFETFVAATSALVHRIPIAHIHGGELTEGAIDDAFRHSITKMSTLHFTSTEEYRKRVIQLGEQPDRVFNVGALGCEMIKTTKLLDKMKLEEKLGYRFRDNTILFTFHPATLENNSAENQIKNILDVLDTFDVNIIFTKSNADTDGRIINRLIDEYVINHSEKSAVYTSLGQLNYLSVLQYCTAVIGNSSSGLLEVPSFHIPTVNIGNRQKGRITAESVICCETEKEDIRSAIKLALSDEFRKKCSIVMNPYEKEGTAEKIITEIKKYLHCTKRIDKEFYNIHF